MLSRASGRRVRSKAQGQQTLVESLESRVLMSGSAMQIVFGTTPGATTRTAGTVFTVTAVLEDADGNVMTGVDSVVKLKIAKGVKGAKLYGTTKVHAVDGVATFSVSVVRAGTFTLQAVSGKLKTTATTNDTFAVNAGAASRVKIEAIQKASIDNLRGLGGLSSVTVGVTDQYGNIVTGDKSNVTLQSFTSLNNQTSLGTSTSEYSTTTAAVNGVVTFTGFTLSHGWHHLVASETGFTGDDKFVFVAFTA